MIGMRRLNKMGQCYSLRHSAATISGSSRVKMIVDSGENGLKNGVYYSIASRDPTNGRVFIKTTLASKEEER